MPNTITNIKRFIGTKFNESGVQAELAQCNFTAVEGPGGETAVEVRVPFSKLFSLFSCSFWLHALTPPPPPPSPHPRSPTAAKPRSSPSHRC